MVEIVKPQRRSYFYKFAVAGSAFGFTLRSLYSICP